MLYNLHFSLVEEGGDWDRRNRLKVYEGIYYMSIREFTKATTNLLDTVSTFTCYEILDYDTFITYVVLCAMLTLERTKLKAKVKCACLKLLLTMSQSGYFS